MHECPDCDSICFCDTEDTYHGHRSRAQKECVHQCPPEEEDDDYCGCGECISERPQAEGEV